MTDLQQAASTVRHVNSGAWKPGDPPTSEEHWDAVCELAAAYLVEDPRVSHLIRSAKHLLFAATGPIGGPENWNEIRERWIKHADAYLQERENAE